MSYLKPVPKTQKQLSEELREPYTNAGVPPSADPKRRELQKAIKGDDAKKFSVTLRDIDEAIFYYFENVIKPSVIRNGSKVNVPIIYGSPERWKAVQADGFYRDRIGKLVTPLIMVKRDSIEKNRNIGNKMDANNPVNFGIFEKKYSKKNIYDRFSILNNRNEIKEYQGVVVPDFVNITYSCIIFTSYVEQMNKLVESINYASDSYWGDTEKFQFRAMIDNYTTLTEIVQGQDRIVKTNFSISLLGHIIPDAINTTLQGSSKFFSKGTVIFGLESVTDASATMATNRLSIARTNATKSRFYDRADDVLSITTIEESMTAEQKAYVTLQKIYTSNTVTVTVNSEANTVTFVGLTYATIPSGFPALTISDHQVFINGLIVETDAINSINQDSGNVVVQFNNTLGFAVGSSDEFTIVGKFA